MLSLLYLYVFFVSWAGRTDLCQPTEKGGKPWTKSNSRRFSQDSVSLAFSLVLRLPFMAAPQRVRQAAAEPEAAAEPSKKEPKRAAAERQAVAEPRARPLAADPRYRYIGPPCSCCVVCRLETVLLVPCSSTSPIGVPTELSAQWGGPHGPLFRLQIRKSDWACNRPTRKY